MKYYRIYYNFFNKKITFKINKPMKKKTIPIKLSHHLTNIRSLSDISMVMIFFMVFHVCDLTQTPPPPPLLSTYVKITKKKTIT